MLERSANSQTPSFLRYLSLSFVLFFIFFFQDKDTQAQPYTLPDKATFDANLVKWGKPLCEYQKAGTDAFDPLLDSTYYDGADTWYLIADYTGDPSWLACADAARTVYRDKYLLPNNGMVAGWYIFSDGLLEDFRRTGNAESAKAISLLANRAPYCTKSDSADRDLSNTLYSREAAYCLLALIADEKANSTNRSERIAELTNHALGHIDQWFTNNSAPYVRPFMVALTTFSLIRAWERNPDARILTALKAAATGITSCCWVPERLAYKYTDRATDSGGLDPAPDLNMIISVLYSWLYRATNDPIYKEQAEAGFRGAIAAAYLARGKQFNQHYRFALTARNYLERSAVPTALPTITPTATRTAQPTATATPNPCERVPLLGTLQCTNYYLRQIRDSLKSQ